MKDFRAPLERLLRKADCYQVCSGKGSHTIWYSPTSERHFPIAAKIKSRHTANEILKQAGLTKAF